MAKPPKNSIYSDEVQNLLLENNTLGGDAGENAWSLDRSTPMDTLKHMMREYYTPNTSLDNKTAKAIVLQADTKIPSFLGTIKGRVTPEMTQLVRISVISDLRTFWIPVPKNSEDPIIGLYPLVKNNTGVKLNVGEVVQVEFHNNKSQFSSITDVGFVSEVIARFESPYLEPLIEKKRTTLPSAAEVKNKKVVHHKIDPKDTSAGKKGQELINDRSFNEKLANIAKRLGFKKADLIQIMAFESGADPAIFNTVTDVIEIIDPITKKKTKKKVIKQFATGLIQFVPKTARGLDTTVEDLGKMTGYEQLDFVEDYFVQQKKTYRVKDLGDLYLMVFYPFAINRPDSYILGQTASGRNKRLKKSLRKLYPGRTLSRHIAIINPYFGKRDIPGGVVTKRIVKDWFTKKWNKGRPKYKDPHAQVYK